MVISLTISVIPSFSTTFMITEYVLATVYRPTSKIEMAIIVIRKIIAFFYFFDIICVRRVYYDW